MAWTNSVLRVRVVVKQVMAATLPVHWAIWAVAYAALISSCETPPRLLRVSSGLWLALFSSPRALALAVSVSVSVSVCLSLRWVAGFWDTLVCRVIMEQVELILAVSLLSSV